MEQIGRCKHGEFNLLQGCPQCVSERLAGELKAKLETNIVKVQYYSETTGELSAREYTYYSVDRLSVGDIVVVPVRDSTGKAQVSAVDVAETEIASFKDKVKMIPSGSAITEKDCEALRSFVDSNDNAPYLPDANDDLPIEPDSNVETALALRPGEDVEVRSYYEEALKLLDYSKSRAITSLDDAKLATDDLSIISRLKKAMEAKRKEKMAPHEAQVKAIRDTYNFLMTPVLEAERITKEKQLIFIHEQKRIEQEQEAINQKRMEAARAEMKLKGELSEPVNLVEVNEASARVQAYLGSSGLVDHWVYEVVDFSIVPDDYKVIDSAMLNAIARKHHDAKKIPGVRFYNEPYLATRTK